MLIASHSKKDIAHIKQKLFSQFDMKDLGDANHILGMHITQDRNNGLLYLSQKEYVQKVLECFNMKKGKTWSTPLLAYLKLSKDDCPKLVKEKATMADIPYALACGSLMYAMVATRLDIAYVVGVVNDTCPILDMSIGMLSNQSLDTKWHNESTIMLWLWKVIH